MKQFGLKDQRVYEKQKYCYVTMMYLFYRKIDVMVGVVEYTCDPSILAGGS